MSGITDKKGSDMRLNGWQRLWILTGVIWLIVVVIFSSILWPGFPSAEKIESNVDDFIERYGDSDISLPINYFQFDCDEVVRRYKGKHPKIIDPFKRNDGRKNKNAESEPLDLFNPELSCRFINFLRDEHENSRDKEIKVIYRFVTFAAIAWLGPVIILYLLGYAVMWVYRGFSRK